MSILFQEIEDLRQRLAVAEGDAKYWREATKYWREANARLQRSLEAANAEVEQLRQYRAIVGMMRLSQLIELTARRGYSVEIALKKNDAVSI